MSPPASPRAGVVPEPRSTDPRIAALLDTLRRSFDGDAWHGPSLADALRGVDARAASARPVAGAHSIWELALHVDAWTREVTRRLGGAPAGDPIEGDWRAAPVPADDGAWAAVAAGLHSARAAFLAALTAFPADQLDRAVPASGQPDEHVRPPTYAATIAGLAEHNAYHCGQIALLRRALAAADAQGEDA